MWNDRRIRPTIKEEKGSVNHIPLQFTVGVRQFFFVYVLFLLCYAGLAQRDSTLRVSCVFGMGASYSNAFLIGKHTIGGAEFKTEVKGVKRFSLQAGIRIQKRSIFGGVSLKTTRQGAQVYVYPHDSLTDQVPPYFYGEMINNLAIDVVIGRQLNFWKFSFAPFIGVDYLPSYYKSGLSTAWIYSNVDPDTVVFESRVATPYRFNWLINGGAELTYRIVDTKGLQLHLGLSSAYSRSFQDLYHIQIYTGKLGKGITHDIRAGRDYWIHQVRVVVTPGRR